MVIINNNNNNGTEYGTTTCIDGVAVAEIIRKRSPRMEMVLLSGYLGWTGAHCFRFGRCAWGVIHLALSLVGFAAIIALPFVYFSETAGSLIYTVLAFIPALFLSIISGACCSLYWLFHSDEDFKKAYPESSEK